MVVAHAFTPSTQEAEAGGPKMLEMPERWDTCSRKLLKGRKKCAAVNEAERSWRSEEHFDIRHADAELVVYSTGVWCCGSSFGQ